MEIKEQIKLVDKLSKKLYLELKALIVELADIEIEGAFIEACCAVDKWEDMDLYIERIKEMLGMEVI